MPRNNRLFSISIIVTLGFFASAVAVNAFYNEAHVSHGLDRTAFQAFVGILVIGALVASLAATWFKVAAQDEVIRAADRTSLYWGWTIGVTVWFLTPWITPLPEWLADAMWNPDGDTLFPLSEVKGAYFGGGFVFMLTVVASWSFARFGWWLAKR